MRFALLFLLSLALLPSSAHAVREDGTLVIVVDPGHGGSKEGAIGPGKAREKDVCLEVSRKLAGALEAAGHQVILTRDTDVDVPLSARVQLANERLADLFVSVHANSMPTAQARAKARGVETYFLSAEATDEAALAVAHAENADDAEARGPAADGPLGAILADLARSEAHESSSRLAYAIHGKLVAATGARDRGVRQAPFFVLEGARMPAVLVEVGYISHPREVKRLVDAAEQERIARAIALGVEAFRLEVLQPKSRAAWSGGKKDSASASRRLDASARAEP